MRGTHIFIFTSLEQEASSANGMFAVELCSGTWCALTQPGLKCTGVDPIIAHCTDSGLKVLNSEGHPRQKTKFQPVSVK